MTRTLGIDAPAPREAAQLTLVVWAAALSVIVPGLAMSGQMASPGEWITLLWGTLAAVLLTGLIYLATRWATGRALWIALPCIVAALLGTALLQMAADYGGQFFVHAFMTTRVPDHSAQSILLVTVIYFLMNACTAALFVILGTVRRIRLREKELAAARVARLETELYMLRLQLNPHFLCNSLNVISSLILTGRAGEANRMTEGLSDFLRATMDTDSGQVPLADELETVERYLELEAARFGPRLQVAIDAGDGTGALDVPSFLLQPLVENAIKHGVEASIGPCTLDISARRDGDALLLAVENRSAGQQSDAPGRPGQGIGLANTRARLAMLYGGSAVLESGPVEGGYRATIRLPLAGPVARRDAA